MHCIQRPFRLEEHVRERDRRLMEIQPWIKLKCRVAMCEQPTWLVESDGTWTKIDRGLSPVMLTIDQECDEEIHHIMNRPFPGGRDGLAE